MADTDACIPGYRALGRSRAIATARTCSASSSIPAARSWRAKDGSIPPAYAPSAVPNERFHVMPVPLTEPLIAEIVAGYGDAARRMRGRRPRRREIVASMGYLPAQFLNPKTQPARGSTMAAALENRLRFLREVVADIRAKTRPGFIVGIRISGDDMDPDTIEPDRGGRDLPPARCRRRSSTISTSSRDRRRRCRAPSISCRRWRSRPAMSRPSRRR